MSKPLQTATIPPKYRKEWIQMITGEIEHSYRNFVLKLVITQLRRELSYHQITMQQAVDRLYALCAKYALAVQSDFKEIFKDW